MSRRVRNPRRRTAVADEYRKNNPSICGAGKAADTGIADIAAGRFRTFDTADTLEDHLSGLSAEALADLSSNADTEQ